MTAHKLARRCRWAGSVLLLAGLSGCSVTWDDITSKDFTVASLWKAPPEPLVVLRDSTDGYQRAKALNKLDEPSQDVGLREKHLQILQTSATTDRDPLCRLAAVRTLGRYKDPRAAKVLGDVYLGNPGLSPENNALVRQQALAALEENGPGEARQLFIRAARQPSGGLTTTATRDRLEILDERLTAIRALGKYSQSDSVETLVHLLESEKDIAVRACAHESLKSATKKDLPADGKAWREFLATGKAPARDNFLVAALKRPDPTPANPQPAGPAEPGVFQKIGNWVRPERAPGQTVSSPGPVQPVSGFGNPVPVAPPQRPAGNPNVTPAGAYRNGQGEAVVPVTP